MLAKTDPSRVVKLLQAYFTVAALEGAAALIYLFSLPADSARALALGFSFQRLLMMAGIFLVSGAFSVLAVASWRKPTYFNNFIEKLNFYLLTGTSFGLLILFGWIGIIPGHNFVRFQAYYERLRPIIIWLALICGQTLALCLIHLRERGKISLKQPIKSQRRIVIAGSIAFIALLILWIGIAWTGIGIEPDERFWGHPGAPLLGYQILISGMVGAILLFGGYYLKLRNIEPDQEKVTRPPRTRIDLAIFLGIWFIAAVLWNAAPFEGNYFAPPPLPPNTEIFPYSDAEVYDEFSHAILNGDGYNQRGLIRPVYAIFLAGLHSIAGEEYRSVIVLQVSVLALFPALIYGLGKSFHGRAFGVMVALLAIFKEMNTIGASPYIQVSHSKLMLTEVPTGLLVMSFTLIVFNWLKDPQRNTINPYLAGGVLGISVLVRMHTLILLPMTLIVSWLVFRRHLRYWIKTTLILAIVTFIAVTPWLIRNYQLFGVISINPNVNYIYDDRYDPGEQNFQPNESDRKFKTIAPQRVEEMTPLEFVPSHFVHNLVTSLLILPTHYQQEPLGSYLLENTPYWSGWEGNLSLGAGLFLLGNVFLIAMGMGTAWRRWGAAGLIPLFMYLGYYLSNAIARTSGWRYTLPVDWVVYFYFCLGLIQFLLWAWLLIGGDIRILPDKPSRVNLEILDRPGSRSWVSRPGLLVSGAYLALSSIMIFSMALVPPRYTPQSAAQLMEIAIQEGLFDNTGLTVEGIERFFESPGAVVIIGQALYPRYLWAGVGEPSTLPAMDSPFVPEDYLRIAFRLVYRDVISVVLPMETSVVIFDTASDVMVIGCRSRTRIDALAVLVLGDDESVYIRSPLTDLSCPFPEP